jgi:hypothetical protein
MLFFIQKNVTSKRSFNSTTKSYRIIKYNIWKKMHSFILLVHFRSHLHWISLTITTIIICLYAKFFSFSVYQPKSKSTFCQQKVLWSTEHLRKHFCLFPTKKYNSFRFTLYPRLFERQYVKETSLNWYNITERLVFFSIAGFNKYCFWVHSKKQQR